jgi:hypothetical protein
LTLVVSINGPESIWLLADRRLSYTGRSPKDDARKVMFLETTDGVAILGYAGLGATARGTEPADWMSAVLRCQNILLEQSLGALADAMKVQFPSHLVLTPGRTHNVVVPAFLGNEVRLYSIDMAVGNDRKIDSFRYTRHVIGKTNRVSRMALTGSGADYLFRNEKRWKYWKRSLLRLVKASDSVQVSPVAVADHLANLNYEVHQGIVEVHQGIVDESVGPRCIVAWRHRKGGVHTGGGGQQFYTGATRDASSPSLPTIACGMDVKAMIDAMYPQMIKNLEATMAGQPAMALNTDEMNAALARLPDKPDKNLR